MAFAWFRPRRARTHLTTRHVRLRVEGMEERMCPAAVLSNRILTVHGTGGGDVINVGASGANIAVGGRLFAGGLVDRIVVVAGAGNDRVTISESVTKPTRIFGGTGADVIYGGGGADEVYGGHGPDRLYGRGGADDIFGGEGFDTLDVGAGGGSASQGSPNRTDGGSSVIEQEILRLTNLERTRRGLPALQLSGQLHFMANQQAGNMAARGVLAHVLNGTAAPTLGARADYAGYEYRAVAENIAYGRWTAAQVVLAWMNSAGHRANILNAGLREIGVGAATNAAGVTFFCQAFGTRL